MNSLDYKFSEKAEQQYQFWIENNPKIAAKITRLIEDVCKHPKMGLGRPEPLKYEFSGAWSRHITLEHRLVYTFDETTVYIISCRYHYR